MKCSHCGHQNTASSKYCSACGARVGVVCSVCQHPNEAGGRFCAACGRPLDGQPAGALPTPYMPESLAQRMLGSRAAMEGERKHVTILFADLKASMELLASRDAEDARALLDPVLERMMEAVHHHEGVVNQVMGDGIMALFGAPLAHEDHALRACYAAMRMKESIARYADEVRDRHGVEVELRVGLNSGEVIVRAITADLRVDYSAVGQSTHLAARMEQLAEPGSILLTISTLSLVEGYVDTKPLGALPVKGLAQPVDVFELTGVGHVDSRWQVAVGRGLTPFVGRDTELLQLVETLTRADAGHGQLLAVVGEPGVGKSRLIWEFLRSHQLKGWRALEGHAVAHGGEAAYGPVVGLLRAYFGILPDDDPAERRGKVRDKLAPDESARFLSPVLALLDAPAEDRSWEGLSPDQRRRRTLEALRHLFIRGSHGQPLCIVLEDLQWADPETQAVLDGLVEALAVSRLLLIVSYRPEYTHAWASKTYYGQLRVDPLPSRSAGDMLRSLLGDGQGMAQLARRLIERTEGNPFFLEESVRHLVETGVLAGERGRHRLLRPAERTPVPETVHAVLAARIDRMEEVDKRVLQAASAVGKDVPLSLLKVVIDLTAEALGQSLDRLQAKEFLYELRVFPEVEYTFKHALTQEVAYGGLLRERRRALDLAIMSAVEQVYSDRIAEQTDRLAHHAVRGEVWDKAVTYCRQAGLRSLARSAHRAAAGCFERALAALAESHDARSMVVDAIDLRLELRAALSPLGEYKRMLQVLTESENLADESGDRHRLGLVSAHLSNFFTLRGDFESAIQRGLRALDLAGSLGDLTIDTLANAHLSVAYFAQGRYREALARARQNIEALTGAHVHERFGMALLPSVYCRTIAALALAELGEFAQAITTATDGIAIAERAEHPHSIVSAYFSLGSVHGKQGHFEAALDALERARRLAEQVDLPTALIEFSTPLASAYANRGAIQDALAVLEAAVAQAVAVRHRMGHWIRTGGFAEAYLCDGRVDQALPLARQFFEITQMVGARGHEAWARRMVGLALARQEPAELDTAMTFLETARDLARQLEMRPLLAHCHFELARLHLRQGRPAEAARDDAEAEHLYADMGLARDWERVRGALAQRGPLQG
jgi:class 3 adenylate cyclase/tetratricopeptide (TPR) repeat protein